VDQINYTTPKAWKALYFVMRVLKKGNRNKKCLTYTLLVCPILEYGSSCWYPCRGQASALDWVKRNRFTLSNNFWSSAETINLINYFCCNLYCNVLLLCYAQYLFFGDCSIIICLFVLYCVVCFVCVLYVFFSDKFHIRLLYDRICGPMK
jgi:hypothetical protein